MKYFLLLAIASLNQLFAVPVLSTTAEVKLDAIVTLYPDHSDKSLFYFFPSDSRIAQNASGRYRFSLGHWNLDSKDMKDGGGFLHVMFNNILNTDQISAMNQFKKDRAKNKLQTKYAPIPFTRTWIEPKSERKYFYVDTEIPPHGTPVEGNIAFSATLTEQGTKYIKRSLELDDEAFQLSYCISSKGLSHSLDASIKADWKSVYEYFKAKYSGNIWIFHTELEREVEKLKTSQTIQIVTNGGDDKERAYIKSVADRIEKKFFKLADKNSPSKESKGKGRRITLKSYKNINSFHLNYQVKDRIKMDLALCNPLGLSDLSREPETYIFDINE